jgi:hypothetical protein
MHDLTTRRLGRGLILSVSALLFLDGATQLAAPLALQRAMAQIGFPSALMPELAAITLACSLLLAFRATALPGAVLSTGFFGGAIALHVRISEIASPPQLICAAMGMMVWLGLFLSDVRVGSARHARAPGIDFSARRAPRASARTG